MADPKYAIKIKKIFRRPILMKDNVGAVFYSSRLDQLWTHLDMYFATARRWIKYGVADISQYEGRVHDITSVIADRDF
jgi:hypothetical protein